TLLPPPFPTPFPTRRSSDLFPTVICGFFFNANASACRRVKEVPAAVSDSGAPCAGGAGVCVAGELVLFCACGDWLATAIAGHAISVSNRLVGSFTRVPPRSFFLPC